MRPLLEDRGCITELAKQDVGKNLSVVCFWQPVQSGLNLVVAAVLRDSLCVVSLLPCVADCCMLYTMRKVEQFVLTIIK